ncbi:hypothetical protein HU200_025561 [Digitaria exilis]|uniref:Uncharacterized protein n=1 Tax=Digitaria exilis TaxID=1010633 RepID=A0A835EXR4_9POAL|nr:hypothetical protein HU200_025561 [Digitaria exilis]
MTVDERMAAARRRDDWPVCDFNEYVQRPRSVWPSDEEVRAYEAGQAPWPCTKYPEKRCKCGILAERGVVPSELGYGWYCGNGNPFLVSAILFAQEGQTCDWEWFNGRDELVARFRRLGQRDKERETRDLRHKIKKKYDVPLPDDELLFGTILDDLEAHDTLIKYWRLNMILYPRPLSRDERAEKRRKLEEKRHLERQV